MTESFSAEIVSAGQGGHAVIVPKDVAAAFSGKRVPVLAHVNGVEYRSRLMVYGGKSFLGLRKDLLRAAAAGTGDIVQIDLVEVEPEVHEQAIAVEPPELLAALAADPEAKAAYDALPFTHRQEYARWIDEGKKAETRAERVRKTITRLTRSPAYLAERSDCGIAPASSAEVRKISLRSSSTDRIARFSRRWQSHDSGFDR